MINFLYCPFQSVQIRGLYTINNHPGRKTLKGMLANCVYDTNKFIGGPVLWYNNAVMQNCLLCKTGVQVALLPC